MTRLSHPEKRDIEEDLTNADLRNLTGEIVTSYLAYYSMPSDDLPGPIQTVYDALKILGHPPAEHSLLTKYSLWIDFLTITSGQIRTIT